MRLWIDEQEIYINGKKVMEHLASFYKARSQDPQQVLELGDGKKLDFTRKSISRTVMKAAMVPVVIPVIGLLYRMRGLEPPRHEKHEDLIDWMVVKMVEFAGIIEEDIHLHATTASVEDIDGDIRRVESVSTRGTDIFNRRRFLKRPEPAELDGAGNTSI